MPTKQKRLPTADLRTALNYAPLQLNQAHKVPTYFFSNQSRDTVSERGEGIFDMIPALPF